ncbi:MAG: redoxin domain-containing protein [Nitrospirae bacterium]|nr:redoxin domain-containing protein [Nitrospirota bacterium]
MGLPILLSLSSGVLAFLSPCFLPILPGFLSYVAGSSVQEMSPEARGWYGPLMRKVLAFVAGFSLVFVTLGATATAVGAFFRAHLEPLRIVAGIALVILGLHLTGLVKIPFLLQERKLGVAEHRVGLGKAFLVGVFFALGWSPCIGPLLAFVLALAAREETARQGMALLLVFSAGLGIPLILSAVFFEGFLRFSARARKHLRAIEIASGAILTLFGVLVMTDRITTISSYLGGVSGLEEKLSGWMGGPDALSLPSDEPPAEPEGDTFDLRAPLETLEGTPTDLRAHVGRLTLVNFFATWCGPCRLETPGFVTLHQRYGGHGFQVIAIAEDSPADQIRKFIQEFGIAYPVVQDPDGKVGEDVGLIGLPVSYLITPDGVIVRIWSGYVKKAELAAEIEARLGE